MQCNCFDNASDKASLKTLPICERPKLCECPELEEQIVFVDDHLDKYEELPNSKAIQLVPPIVADLADGQSHGHETIVIIRQHGMARAAIVAFRAMTCARMA